MKILKRIGIGIVALIVLLLVVALFVPREYTVSVSETINRPQKEVFDYIKIIKNQEVYSVWLLEDPKSKKDYIGTDGTVGFVAKWNSTNDNVGEGEQEITNITAERIDIALRFKRPFESNQKAATMAKAINENQTLVTAEFYGHDPYPLNLMSLIGKNIISKAQTQNLKNLKNILEK